DRQILQTAATRAKKYNKDAIENAEAKAYQKLEDENVTIIRLEDKSEWQEAMDEIYKSYAGSHYDLIEKIRSVE
nr:TRAP transporter substrate-binding protein DctP [Lachnospiraceae bacterium]